MMIVEQTTRSTINTGTIAENEGNKETIIQSLYLFKSILFHRCCCYGCCFSSRRPAAKHLTLRCFFPILAVCVSKCSRPPFSVVVVVVAACCCLLLLVADILLEQTPKQTLLFPWSGIRRRCGRRWSSTVARVCGTISLANIKFLL
jgi:hypothetical protein